MKKSRGVIVVLVMIAALAAAGFITFFGIGENGYLSAKNTKLGLDLAGGVSITYEVVGDAAPSAADLDDTVFKLRKRVDQYSTESNVYPEGDRRISIEIPGVTDANAILADLGSPGSLYFIRALSSVDGSYNYELLTTASDGQQVYREDGTYFITIGTISYLYDRETGDPKTDANGSMVRYEIQNASHVQTVYHLTRPIDEIVANGDTVISGTDVASSEAQSYTDDFNQTQHVVSLSFTPAGSSAFAEATGEAAGKQSGDLSGTIGIYYDGEMLSVPHVNEKISGGSAQITGMADAVEAQNLAQNIRIGGLKLELSELRSNVVGAQLGSDAVRTSLLAGLIGLAIIILFMCVNYKLPGFASSIGLVLYALLDVMIINLFELTLTLPGIAGIILSIGMAVDANVIIFARIKEELKSGSSVKGAIDEGFAKALSAIIDGNITTLIAALVLIGMGSGTIKGFGYTLAIGIILSMFTALVITKSLINAFYALGLQNEKLYGMTADQKKKEDKVIDFISKKNLFFCISIGVICIGVAAMAIFGAKTGDALNYSLEFKGGTATTVAFSEVPSADVLDNEIVPVLENITGDANVSYQLVNDTNEVIFKTRVLDVDERQEFIDYMETDQGVLESQITAETIGSTISGEMKRESITAVAVAAILMLIYIWFRFSDIRFGISSVAALVHDVLVTLTFYAVVRLSVSSTFIACMLTIVGYSINATIVIFDRIRENLKSMKRKDTLADVVNRSVSQTLSRSIFTSLTTVIMVVMLYILGVSSIREFALPLMIGIVSGTYSSVCVTGALWYVLRQKFKPSEDDDD
ncbi:MAG: protein translocase subunit SecD [Lachnospiraceae bacterium]|nr:protein translocase subunit SecD [Lachnospiraceae bacterium]